MKTNLIKEKINESLNQLNSSSYDDVLKKINNQKGVILNMKKEETKTNLKNYHKAYKIAFASLLLLFAGIVGINYFNQNKVLATINLDVNPSIELKINGKNKIKEVIANNEEGQEIIKNMDLENTDLEVGTNAILGSMLKLGYITNEKNSILVSVVGDNKKQNEEIRELLVKDINSYLSENTIDGSVMSQVVESTKTTEDLAKEYNITIGKAELINKIIANNPLYSFEKLATLSTNELNLLASSKKNNVETINITGNANDSEYIGKDKAKQIALNHAKASNVSNVSVELDYDDNVMIYEVEFNHNNYEYDYDINAKTGVIVDYEKERDDSKNTNTNNTTATNSTSSSYITKNKAQQIAFNHAKVNSNNVRDFDIEFDKDDGRAIYNVEFKSGNKEYDYDIDAKTGKIIDVETDIDD